VLIEDCKEQKLEAEQVRDETIIQHGRIERRKEEEIRRLHGAFDKIFNMLSQKRLYLVTQLTNAYDNLLKSHISDIAISESQAEYAENLLAKLTEFYDQHFRKKRGSSCSPKCGRLVPSLIKKAPMSKFKPISQPDLIKKDAAKEDKKTTNINSNNKEEDEKLKSDITSLNDDINSSLPYFQEQFAKIKKKFQYFIYSNIVYPEFNANSNMIKLL